MTSERLPQRLLTASLCGNCRWMREIVSGKGSRFLLCQLSLSDGSFRKYPPQPIVRCRGYCASSSHCVPLSNQQSPIGNPQSK